MKTEVLSGDEDKGSGDLLVDRVLETRWKFIPLRGEQHVTSGRKHVTAWFS